MFNKLLSFITNRKEDKIIDNFNAISFDIIKEKLLVGESKFIISPIGLSMLLNILGYIESGSSNIVRDIFGNEYDFYNELEKLYSSHSFDFLNELFINNDNDFVKLFPKMNDIIYVKNYNASSENFNLINTNILKFIFDYKFIKTEKYFNKIIIKTCTINNIYEKIPFIGCRLNNTSYFKDDHIEALKIYSKFDENGYRYSMEFIKPVSCITGLLYNDIINIKYVPKNIVFEIPELMVSNNINLRTILNKKGIDINNYNTNIKENCKINKLILNSSIIMEYEASYYNINLKNTFSDYFIADKTFYWIIRNESNDIISIGFFNGK